MLLPILDIIPKLESQYEDIAKAVDIVRHKLEVKDMPLPKDKASEGHCFTLFDFNRTNIKNVHYKSLLVPYKMQKLLNLCIEMLLFI